LQACSHKYRVQFGSRSERPYCVGACLNVTEVDSANSSVTYRVLSPPASYHERRSQTGTSLHITEVQMKLHIIIIIVIIIIIIIFVIDVVVIILIYAKKLIGINGGAKTPIRWREYVSQE